MSPVGLLEQSQPSGCRRMLYERVAFVNPARDAADHFLDRTAEPREANRGFVRAIAVRSDAVDDEKRFGGVFPQHVRDDRRSRDVDSLADMAAREIIGSAYVEEYEPRGAGLQRCVDIGAVGFEFQFC